MDIEPKVLWLRKNSSFLEVLKVTQHQLRNWPTPFPKHYAEPMIGYGTGVSSTEGHSCPALGRLNGSCLRVFAWEWGR